MNEFEEAAVQSIITNKNALTLLDKSIEALRQTNVKNTILRKSNAELQDQNLELLKTIKRLRRQWWVC